jgi:poly-beta-1,6-N-acetyl-D-glucosamine synthase
MGDGLTTTAARNTVSASLTAPDLFGSPLTAAPDGFRVRPTAESQLAGLQHLARIADEQAAGLAATLPAPSASRPQAPKITVLIPAHNEAAGIGQTIRSLRGQTRPADSITVVCDNCTDDTAAVAAAAGARVITTAGNTGRKAGALNQALRQILPRLRGADMVLIMDADSEIDRNWIESAAARMESAEQVGGLCGVFRGEDGKGMLGQLQRNEYARAARAVSRRSRIWVLSGCGTLLRVSALRKIAKNRGAVLPGVRGDYFDATSITEDFELTLGLLTLGYQCVASPACVAVTEVMPNLRDVWRQRLRWQKGTIRDLRHYGINQVTWWHWLNQAFGYTSYVVQGICWAVMGDSLATGHHVDLAWGAGALGIALIERMSTAQKAGWRGVGLASTVLLEFAYGLYLQAMMMWALVSEFLQVDIAWNHVAVQPA